MLLYNFDMKNAIPDIFVKINDCARFNCRPDWHWDTMNGFPDFDLWTILGGCGVLHNNGVSYNFSRGDCFLLRPGERYVGEHDPDNPLRVIYIHFIYVDSRGSEIPYGDFPVPRLYRRIADISFFEKLLEKTAAAFQSPSGLLQANNWLNVVLQEMAENDLHAEYAGNEAVQRSLIENVCDRIRKEPGKSYKVRDLAREFSFSQDHFCRIFKKYKKTTPGDFIATTRIDAARQLLISSNYPVARIAEILGYNDIYHFSKAFRQKTGMAPSEFRKSWNFVQA